MTGKGTLFSAVDYGGRTVSLDEDTYSNHICSGHPEMGKNVQAIENAVVNPEVVYESVQGPHREVFFSRVPESTYPKLYTKVVVDYSSASGGVVKSSWFEKGITGVKDGGLKHVRAKTR